MVAKIVNGVYIVCLHTANTWKCWYSMTVPDSSVDINGYKPGPSVK